MKVASKFRKHMDNMYFSKHKNAQFLNLYYPCNKLKSLKGKNIFNDITYKDIVTRDVKTLKRKACRLIHFGSRSDKVFVDKNVDISYNNRNKKRCTGRACEKKVRLKLVEGMNYSPIFMFAPCINNI
jgi:hypothetical protein